MVTWRIALAAAALIAACGIAFADVSGPPCLSIGATPICGSAASLAGLTSLSLTNGSNAVTLGDGSWFTSSVAYIRPNTTNTPGVLDVLANGSSPGSNAAWIDIGSDYVGQQPNGEFLMLTKGSGSYAAINVKGLGTGVGRALVLNDTSFSGVGANGGTSAIGFNAPPASSYQYYAEFDQNGATRFDVVNASGGGGAYTTMEVANGVADGNYIRLITLGAGWSTNGAFAQNSGMVEAGANLAGLNIAARGSSAGIGLYSGGVASGNLRGSITSDGDVQIGNGSAIATNATAGFFAFETTNGVPSGTPTHAAAGLAQCVVDYADLKLECYINGGWKHLTFASGT